jgi:hypothetical protein
MEVEDNGSEERSFFFFGTPMSIKPLAAAFAAPDMSPQVFQTPSHDSLTAKRMSSRVASGDPGIPLSEVPRIFTPL